MKRYIFESERLAFRFWEEKDKIPFGRMNSNHNVMKYFPKFLTQKESDAFVERINAHFKAHGFGLWAVELKASSVFIGFIGFQIATFQANFTPCIEIGWRLDDEFWNKGYATEGAKRCLQYGFDMLYLKEIYSFTAERNKASENVMKKIGMKKQLEFNHPLLPKEDPLLKHVLYKINKD